MGRTTILLSKSKFTTMYYELRGYYPAMKQTISEHEYKQLKFVDQLKYKKKAEDDSYQSFSSSSSDVGSDPIPPLPLFDSGFDFGSSTPDVSSGSDFGGFGGGDGGGGGATDSW